MSNKDGITVQRVTAVIVLLALLFLILPQSDAQVTGESIIIEISKDGHARVTEELSPSPTVSRITVTSITAEISNILVVDENQVVLSFSKSGNAVTIDTLGSANVTLRYDAKIVNKVSSEIWELNYSSEDIASTIVLPSMSDLIYVNNIPVDIMDNVVIMPPGDISLRYTIKSVDTKNFVISWDGVDYVVHIVSASTVQAVTFEQKSMSMAISLDTRTPVLVIIPKSLLGGPYSVTEPAGESIAFKQYYQNATHAWIRVEPSDRDSILIVGSSVVPEFLGVPVVAGIATAISLLIASLNKRSTH